MCEWEFLAEGAKYCGEKSRVPVLSKLARPGRRYTTFRSCKYRAHVRAPTIRGSIRVLCVVAFVVMVATRQYYTWYMPGAPQLSEHRVVAVSVNYGKTIYVTNGERTYLYATYTWCALMLLLLVVRSNYRLERP